MNRAWLKLISLVAIAAGCGPSVNVRSFSAQPLPPSPGVGVQTAIPEQPHDTVAELTTARGPEAVRMLTDKARELGADLLVIVEVTNPSSNTLARTRDAVVTTGMARASERGKVRAFAVRMRPARS
jgi:hypothetical protein